MPANFVGSRCSQLTVGSGSSSCCRCCCYLQRPVVTYRSRMLAGCCLEDAGLSRRTAACSRPYSVAAPSAARLAARTIELTQAGPEAKTCDSDTKKRDSSRANRMAASPASVRRPSADQHMSAAAAAGRAARWVADGGGKWRRRPAQVGGPASSSWRARPSAPKRNKCTGTRRADWGRCRLARWACSCRRSR